jgi:hypothetical protein
LILLHLGWFSSPWDSLTLLAVEHSEGLIFIHNACSLPCHVLIFLRCAWVYILVYLHPADLV